MLLHEYQQYNNPIDSRHFNKFRNKHIKQSLLCYNNLCELRAHYPKADCYIAGSDQIWAQLLSFEDNKSFYLDFGPKDMKRISYAPSFAMNQYPKNLEEILKKELSLFDVISVREQSGVEICKQIGFNAKLVLDPTMLLSITDYEKIIQHPTTTGPYCFIYAVNVSDPELFDWNNFRDHNTNHNIDSIAVWANRMDGQMMETLQGAHYVYPRIEEWLGYIKDAEYCLTSSFHGVVFSIIFHTPFIVVLRPDSQFAGNDRIMTLLSNLGIENRILVAGGNNTNILNEKIIWEDIDKKLDKLRRESISFLSNSISRKR